MGAEQKRGIWMYIFVCGEKMLKNTKNRIVQKRTSDVGWLVTEHMSEERKNMSEQKKKKRRP